MYYKGNNIGLNYDAATGTWLFNNEPQDYIDTNAFSTADPKFDYTPPSNDDSEEEEDTNCPEGYIYDNTLKQCVPDPARQNQYSQQQNQGGNNNTSPVQIAGTNRTTTDGNFIATDDEYSNMTASELVENYKQRRFIKKNDKGELVIDFSRVKRKGGILDTLFGRVGQPQDVEEMASLNKVIDYLTQDREGGPILTKAQIYGTTAAGQTQFNNQVVIPTIAKFEADYYGIPYSDVIAPGFGDSIFGTTASVQKFDDYMSKKLDAFKVVANNAISNYTEDNYLKESGVNEIEKEKARKAKFDADIAKAKLEREMQKTIKEAEQNQAEKEKEEKQEKKKDEVKDLYNQYGQVTYNTQDTGGYVTTPNDPGNAPNYPGNQDYNTGSSSSSSTGQTGGYAGSGITSPPKDKPKCFHPEQLIGNKFIKDLEPGDLINGIKILGMVKLKLDEDMYSLNDVKVTGTHKVKYNNTWMYVSNHPESFKINDKPEFVYVPIVEGGTFIINNNEFADYDDEHIETLNNRLKIA